MDTIIYRKGDNLIAGYSFPRRSPEQTEEAVAVEIENICQSELGGVPDSYATVEVERALRPGHLTVVNPDGSVSFTAIGPTPRRARASNC